MVFRRVLGEPFGAAAERAARHRDLSSKQTGRSAESAAGGGVL
jgi:hypothetical protein